MRYLAVCALGPCGLGGAGGDAAAGPALLRRLLPGLFLAVLTLGLGSGAALAADCTPNATSIVADCTDYLNDQTLDTLTNDAEISSPVGGAAAALANDGTITTLDNNESIIGAGDGTDQGIGLHNSGTITTLTNDGTISGIMLGSDEDGATYGVLNNGTIGSLVNTGEILGAFGIRSYGNIIELENHGTITGVEITANGGQASDRIDNAGSITAPTSPYAFGAVSLNAGTFTDIVNSGTIDGDTIVGVSLLNVLSESFENSGLISGQMGMMLLTFGEPATVIDLLHNGVDGTITGEQMGLLVTGSSIGQLSNEGVISGTGDTPLLASLSAITLPEALAGLNGNAAMVVAGSTIGTLDNVGSMSSASEGTAAALLSFGSSFEAITNAEGATMSASGAVSLGAGFIGGGVGTLTNAGDIEVEASGDGSLGIGLLAVGPQAVGTDGLPTEIGAIGSTGTITASGDIAMGSLLGLASVESFDNSGTLSAEGATLGAGLLVLSSDIGDFSNSGLISGTGAYSGGMALVGLGAVGDNLDDSGIGALLGGSGNPVLEMLGALDDTTLETPAGIESFDNAGTITGGLLGLYVANAEIGDIGNSGTISSGSVALYLDGGASVGDIDNSGEITGPEAMAMYADASFGSITNSGTIAGTIKNRTGSDLTFIGGSGDAFGLITGYSADPQTPVMGLIESLAGDVVFQSGNMQLNADIDVGSGLVRNAGTLRIDGAVTITGNYTQSAAGKLVIAATTHEIGKLTVSGLADLTDSTIIIVPIGGYRLSGDVANILSAGSLDVTGLTLKAGTETISFDTDTVDDLTRLLASLPDNGPSSAYAQIGAEAGEAGGAMGAALDIIAGEGSDAAIDFQSSVLVALLGLDDADQPAAIAQLAPSADTPDWQMGFTAGSLFTDAVAQRQMHRMNGSVAGQSGPNNYVASPALPLAPVWDRVLVDPASGTADAQVWAQALGGVTDADGYSLAGGGLALGADIALSQDVLLGAAGSWLATTAEPDLASGTASTQQLYQGLVYGSWRPGALSLDAQVGHGLSRTMQSRAIAFLGDIAQSDFGGTAMSLHAEAGYDLPLLAGSAGELVFTPLAGVDFSRSGRDGYIETGAGAANLSVDAQDVSSLTSSLGAKVAWSMLTDMGRLTPELRAAWLHEHIADPIVTTGTLAGTAFAVSNDRPAADGAELGLSVSLESGAMQFGADYAGQFRVDQASHAFTLSGAVRF